MNIAGFDKALLLVALYNVADSAGLVGSDYDPHHRMTIGEARRIIKRQGLNFDRVRGRVLKVCLDGDELDTYRYDRDNGCGRAEHAITYAVAHPETVQDPPSWRERVRVFLAARFARA